MNQQNRAEGPAAAIRPSSLYSETCCHDLFETFCTRRPIVAVPYITKAEVASVQVGGETTELPIISGTEGERAADIGALP